MKPRTANRGPADDGYTKHGLFPRLEVALEERIDREQAQLDKIPEPVDRAMTLGEKFAFISGYQSFALALINAVNRAQASNNEITLDATKIVEDALECGAPGVDLLASILDPSFPTNYETTKP